jgi:hypothetical protein
VSVSERETKRDTHIHTHRCYRSQRGSYFALRGPPGTEYEPLSRKRVEMYAKLPIGESLVQ